MKRAALLGSALLLMAGVSGCGGDTHDKQVQELIQYLDATANLLDKIDDKKTAEQNAAALEEKGKKLKELMEKAQADGSLTAEEKERLRDQYKNDVQKGLKRLYDAWARLQKNKKFNEILTALQAKNALADFGYLK
jgi:hypothetical protein